MRLRSARGQRAHVAARAVQAELLRPPEGRAAPRAPGGRAAERLGQLEQRGHAAPVVVDARARPAPSRDGRRPSPPAAAPPGVSADHVGRRCALGHGVHRAAAARAPGRERPAPRPQHHHGEADPRRRRVALGRRARGPGSTSRSAPAPGPLGVPGLDAEEAAARRAPAATSPAPDPAKSRARAGVCRSRAGGPPARPAGVDEHAEVAPAGEPSPATPDRSRARRPEEGEAHRLQAHAPAGLAQPGAHVARPTSRVPARSRRRGCRRARRPTRWSGRRCRGAPRWATSAAGSLSMPRGGRGERRPPTRSIRQPPHRPRSRSAAARPARRRAEQASQRPGRAHPAWKR